MLFLSHDILVIHIDADVAGKSYHESGTTPDSGDRLLPCELDCPPASATVDALREVLLSWLGETQIPPRTVLCVPSKSTEAWVVAALFPNDEAMRKGMECWTDPENRLAQQPRSRRIRKTQRDYEANRQRLSEAWPLLVGKHHLGEAKRFQHELLSALPP